MLHIGNLSKDVTEEDLHSLLSLNTTKYIKQISYLVLIKFEKTNKCKGFIFNTTPTHVYKRLLELNGVNLKGKNMVIEEAMSKRQKWQKKDSPVDTQKTLIQENSQSTPCSLQ